MKFLSQKRYYFVPKINDNEQLPEGERVEVEIIRATAENHAKLKSIRAGRNADGSPVLESYFDTKEILHSCVGEIKNLEIEEQKADGKITVKKITNGKELASSTFYGCDTLVSLICAEVASDTISSTEKKICE